jgi:MFS family permease
MTADEHDSVRFVPKRDVARLSPNVAVLGVVSLLMGMSSAMIYALLPVFLVTVLGASTTAVGLIEGIAEATTSAMKIFSAAASDLIGRRKPLVVVGYALSALSKLLFPSAEAASTVLIAGVCDRIGKGIRDAPRSNSASAPICSAISADERSLSITASMPRSPPSGVATTGIPPPPAQMTIIPECTSSLIALISRMRRGLGNGTARRKPRPSGTKVHGARAASCCASRPPYTGPIGLLGLARAGSDLSTSTWVSKVTISRPGNSFPSPDRSDSRSSPRFRHSERRGQMTHSSPTGATVSLSRSP